MTKYGLTIGTNYTGTPYALSGCENDAMSWSDELDRRGHQVTSLIGREASRAGILGSLERAVASLGYRDQLVVTNSSHGTWTPDRDGDEADGRDEAICPDDFDTAGLITDDDLHRVFSGAGFGERVVMISDSCHSGTLNRFAGPVVDAETPRRVRFLPPAVWLPADALDAARAVQHVPARGFMRRGALTFSACAAGQVTYDVTIGGKPCGLFTYVALEVLRGLPGEPSYRDWWRQVRRLLPSTDFPDVAPQLDGTSTQKRWGALA